MTGQELDILIAQHLFGWTEEKTEINDWHEPVSGLWKSCDKMTSLPLFSTDPAACALVLDEIERQEWYWNWSTFDPGLEYHYIFEIAETCDTDWVYSAGADNRYRAVCLAVLKALGE